MPVEPHLPGPDRQGGETRRTSSPIPPSPNGGQPARGPTKDVPVRPRLTRAASRGGTPVRDQDESVAPPLLPPCFRPQGASARGQGGAGGPTVAVLGQVIENARVPTAEDFPSSSPPYNDRCGALPPLRGPVPRSAKGARPGPRGFSRGRGWELVGRKGHQNDPRRPSVLRVHHPRRGGRLRPAGPSGQLPDGGRRHRPVPAAS